MPRKKAGVPKEYVAAIQPSWEIVSDAFLGLLSRSVEAEWLFSTARLTWLEWVAAPTGSDREHEAGDIGRAAVTALVQLVYQSDERVRRLIAPADLTRLVTEIVTESVTPGAAAHSPPVGLLRLAPDDKLSVRLVDGRPIIDGAGDASLDDLVRAKKALDVSEAIRHGRDAPSQRGRRREPHYVDEAAFRAWISPYVRSVRKRDGSAGKEAVAAEVPTEPTHLGRRCQELTGLDWPSFAATVPDAPDQ